MYGIPRRKLRFVKSELRRLRPQQLRGAEWPPSSPYADTYAGFGDDIDKWSKEDFAEYYRRLLKKTSKEDAWRILTKDLDRVWWFNTDVLDACLVSCSFCQRFYKEFGREWPLTDTIESVACKISRGAENVASAGETVTQIPDVAATTLKYATPVLLGLGIWVGGKALKFW